MKRYMKKRITMICCLMTLLFCFGGCSKKEAKDQSMKGRDIDRSEKADQETKNFYEQEEKATDDSRITYSASEEIPSEYMDEADQIDSNEINPIEYKIDAIEAPISDSDMSEDWAYNNEKYSTIVENGFQDVTVNPLSTFSADVDTASYANIRRMIFDGMPVDPNAVRIEEMINYFHYKYEEPAKGQPFGVTKEIITCPWNKENMLLSVNINTKAIDSSKLPDSNLVFLLDVSGSMSDEDKLPLMVNAFTMLADEFDKNDRISVVTYAGYDQVLLSGVCGDQKKLIIDTLESLSASGSTNGSDGIITAYELAKEYYIEGGNNRVILATDGDLNVGLTSLEELQTLIEEERKSGIFLSVLGFGSGNLKDDKMEILADCGNGNYSYIDSIKEAKKVLLEEMGGTLFTVAKDVKLQVEFNPAKVAKYRLIGYENRVMEAEDFNDDTKDAGELGAGHYVTALYELVPAGKEVTVKSDLKYQSTVLTDSKDYAYVSIRYKEPDSDESKLLQYPVRDFDVCTKPSEEIKFAACVAEFGMLLRGSEYSGNATYKRILDQLNTLPSVKYDEYRAEFRYLVETLLRVQEINDGTRYK